ncbi:NLI interacting factor-like phosphatase [Melia azedarach]|uniref:NLI interacting factor-like phosphatase n=1 Tax=Melia azedarach TaxID=155640 RepID=A0ACC1X832_MELAZ|nr:NLI interacting factor-like phosphatase [Melia azedarach]
MTKREMKDTIFELDSLLQPAFIRILKMGTGVPNGSVFGDENHDGMENHNQLKITPENELQENAGPTNMDPMNNMSTLCLPDERRSAEKVIASESPENQDATLAIINKEDSLFTISLSSQLGAPIFHLRKKLLVLDLNGLLADIVSPPPKDYKADINIARRAVFKRPFYLEFLWFCFERFEVGVWSSRNKKNVERVVDFLLGDMKHKLLFCWVGFNTLENKHKALVFKELKKIWHMNEPNPHWKKGDYNESNTLLLDDSPYKALLNPPHTAIFPYSYKFQDRTDNSLGAGGDLRVYLERLVEAENVQKFVEQHPFGQNAITNRSESWDFYLQVLNTLCISRASV